MNKKFLFRKYRSFATQGKGNINKQTNKQKKTTTKRVFLKNYVYNTLKYTTAYNCT